MKQALLERFVRYARIDTQSNGASSTYPSTPGQWDLLRLLKTELDELGVRDATLTRHGYVLATLPATLKGAGARGPVVAFLAHVDTAPDASGKNVKPVVHKNYKGGAIRFPDDPSLVLEPAESPDLAAAVGHDIVTASGTTLLGGDDKAGVAVLMTLAEHLLKNPQIPHGPIRVCFTPDEEIGKGVDHLSLEELGADAAYTLDGGGAGEINWETFSADAATVTIEGVSTHPMEARAKGMINALHLAAKLVAALPRERCAPETTGGRQGFIHPTSIQGRVERAEIEFILRDFDLEGLKQKGAMLRGLCQGLQASEPRAKVRCQIRKQYRNMAYWLREDMRPVEMAREAFRAIGIEPREQPVRGGTDGSRLTERGLPTPNLFCGEHNAHGRLEWVSVQEMEQAVGACVELARLWGGAKPSSRR